MVTRKRRLAKALGWRIFSTLVTLFLVYFFVGDFSIATMVAVINFFLKTILYYLHEIIWEGIKWGKK